jgi:predicted amidohydrolase YtcJ
MVRPHREASMRALSFLRGRLVSLAAVAAVSLLAGAAEAAPSRTIFHGGTVFTSNPGALWAQAIAVEDGRVIAVGSNAAVLARANHHTRVIDLGGRVVIPGLNDAHVHVVVPQGAYLNAPTFVPGPGPGLAEIEGILAGGASATPPGTWLFAFFGSAIFDDDQANRFALDTVSPDHPVVLFGWTGHGMLLNSKAMEMLGISETEPDPHGGHFVRVPGSNVITGEAHEYAEFGIRRRLLGLLSDADIVDQYRVFADQAARLGYTSLQDMAIGLTQERTLRVLGAAKLPLRVRSICFPLTPGEDCEVTCEPNEKKGALVRASGTKWITDGTPIERLAFVETP